MYIDDKRSWFLHSDKHVQRTEGGIENGSIVGILLNLQDNHVCFYVNDEKQGTLELSDVKGTLYPAISLNRNVQVTINSGLELPNLKIAQSQ